MYHAPGAEYHLEIRPLSSNETTRPTYWEKEFFSFFKSIIMATTKNTSRKTLIPWVTYTVHYRHIKTE